MQEPAPIHPTDHIGMSSEAAARIMGVSLTTIRRWIREGKLSAERVERPQGYVLQVQVPSEAVLAAAPADVQAPRRLHVATAPSAPVETGVAAEQRAIDQHMPQTVDPNVISLIERQQQTIMELSGRVGYLQAELANARDTIRAFQAPAEELVAVGEVGRADAADPSSANIGTSISTRTRRWWQRLLWV